jgi:OFA family oxalate/formate antiporter-like MFS transporter
LKTYTGTTIKNKTNRHSIYFGWYILAAAVILTSYQSATFTYGFTNFLTPIATTLGWSYAQISLATTIRGIQVGAMDPFVGMIVDRWPARWLMILGTLTYAVGVVILSKATSLAVFYTGFMVMGLGGTFCYSMVPQTILARWFKKNIGKVSGFLSMGFSIGGMFVPFIVKGIDAFGWQRLMQYLALGVVVLGLPLALLFRNRPEEYGLLPDGAVPLSGGAPQTADDSVIGFKDVLKMRAFWLIGIASMFHMIAVNALTIHIVPYLTSASVGMTREMAALSITIFSLVSLGIRLLYGFLADIYPKKNVFAISGGITTVALVMLGMINNTFTFMVIFSIVYAFGVAGSTSLRVPIARDYFGAKNFGKIFGWICLFSVVGGVAGAPLAGWVYDTQGTYFPIWYIFAGMTALATILFLMLPLPAAARKSRELTHA